MTHFTRTIFLLLLASIVVTRVEAQPASSATFMAGPTIGLASGFITAGVPVYAGSFDCGEFTSGRSTSSSLGLAVLFPSFFSDRLGLGINLSGSALWNRLTALPAEPLRVFDADVGEPVTLDREFRLKTTLLQGSLELSARYRITDRWSASIGPVLGFQGFTTASQTDNILGPGDYRFPDGQSEHPMEGGEVLHSSPLLFGAVVSSGYTLPVGRTTVLLPELVLAADLTSPAKDRVWRTLSVGGRLSLLFDVSPSTPPVHAHRDQPRPVETHEPAPKHPLLTASLELYGLDANNSRLPIATVRVQEVLYRQHAPLLPVIYFDHDSAALADRYVRLTRSAADSFSMEDLAGLDLLEIQHQALNVIGYRLRADRTLRLSLVPSTSSDEPPALARDRAESMFAYLTGIWRIEPSRIVIHEGGSSMQRSNEATEDGRQDNRRVEIVPSSGKLLDEVMTDEVVRDFDPPMIRMNPVFQAEAGVKDWNLIVTQGGVPVAHYSRVDSGDLANRQLVWNIVRGQIDSALSPLVATLTVIDSTGARTEAHASIPLLLERRVRVVDRRIELHGDRERISFGLVAFDYNTATPGRIHDQEVRQIAGALHDSAEVTITGYTDRIGDERYNVGLSAQRAERVASILRAAVEELGLHDVKIHWSGAGVERERFDNALPEGRGLSRGVSVVVEQTAGEPAPGH